MSLDQKVLFAALGFMAAILNQSSKKDTAKRAKVIAQLMEDYCRLTAPEAFPQKKNRELEIKELIQEMVLALELCLESEGLSWEAEHEAELVMLKAKRCIQSGHD